MRRAVCSYGLLPVTLLALAQGCVIHPGSAQKLAVNDCKSCHVDKMSTAAITHTTAESDCKQCHDLQDWANVTYTHDLPFVLEGAHTQLDCATCHTAGFHDNSTDCWSCHSSDYNATHNPQHEGFSHDCAMCHSQTAWEGAKFVHQNFSLSGAHLAVVEGGECSSCHVNNLTDEIDGTCINCHQPDYDSARSPNHTAMGLSTSCASCHTQAAWTPTVASFHDGYYRLSGNHASLSCRDCHTGANPSDYTCTDCHTHSQSNTDGRHNEVGGYTYESNRCFACHKNGTGDD